MVAQKYYNSLTLIKYTNVIYKIYHKNIFNNRGYKNMAYRGYKNIGVMA